jgi:hypothetical protein
MTDHAIDKLWEALNEEDDLNRAHKTDFIHDCRKYGMLTAIFNLGWKTGNAYGS